MTLQRGCALEFFYYLFFSNSPILLISSEARDFNVGIGFKKKVNGYLLMQKKSLILNQASNIIFINHPVD